MSMLDTAIALRIIQLLTSPFNKWDAFKKGIIDENGKQLTKNLTPDQESAWTMLHRLVWRLKLIIGKIPGGRSQLVSMAAAYLLVRECYDNPPSDLHIRKALSEKISRVTENDISLIEDGIVSGPTNSTSTVMAQTRNIPEILNRKKMITRFKNIKKVVDNGNS